MNFFFFRFIFSVFLSSKNDSQQLYDIGVSSLFSELQSCLLEVGNCVIFDVIKVELSEHVHDIGPAFLAGKLQRRHVISVLCIEVDCQRRIDDDTSAQSLARGVQIDVSFSNLDSAGCRCDNFGYVVNELFLVVVGCAWRKCDEWLFFLFWMRLEFVKLVVAFDEGVVLDEEVFVLNVNVNNWIDFFLFIGGKRMIGIVFVLVFIFCAFVYVLVLAGCSWFWLLLSLLLLLLLFLLLGEFVDCDLGGFFFLFFNLWSV